MLVIRHFICGKTAFVADEWMLIAVELVIFYVTGDPFVFQELVILVAAVTGVRCDVGWFDLQLLDMRGQMCG